MVPDGSPGPTAPHAVRTATPCEICGSTDARPTSGGKWWCLACGFLYS